MRSSVVAVFVSLLAFSASSRADDVIKKPVAADTPDKFAAVVQHVRDEMKSGGRYEFIKPDDRGKVDADLDTMQDLLTKAGSVDAMKSDDRLRLFNTQEHVNGILVHNDSNRLVCERRAPVGTSIPQTTCRTVAEIERMRSASGAYLQDREIGRDGCRNSGLCSPNEHASRGSH
jgi:hypothetical protein